MGAVLGTVVTLTLNVSPGAERSTSSCFSCSRTRGMCVPRRHACAAACAARAPRAGLASPRARPCASLMLWAPWRAAPQRPLPLARRGGMVADAAAATADAAPLAALRCSRALGPLAGRAAAMTGFSAVALLAAGLLAAGFWVVRVLAVGFFATGLLRAALGAGRDLGLGATFGRAAWSFFSATDAATALPASELKSC